MRTRRPNWEVMCFDFPAILCTVLGLLMMYFRNSILEEGVVGKAPIMTICTHRNSGGVSAVSNLLFLDRLSFVVRN
jgi:hypothetical protein